MRSRASLATVLVVGLVGGCTVGPHYRVPLPPTGADRSFILDGPGSVAAPLPASWWRLYQDPVLDDLVQKALTANTDLKVAAANLAYAQAVTEEALAGRFPQTTVSAGAAYEKLRTPQAGVPSGPSFVYSAGLAANYEIDLFGRVRRSIEAARANADAQLAAEDQVRVTVAAATAGSYAAACGYGEQLSVARRSLAILQQGYDLTVLQRNAGALSDFDVDREAVLLANAKAAIAPLEGQHNAELYTLAALTGETPGQIPVSVGRCTIPPSINTPLPVGDGFAMLRRRPDLRQAERNLAAATARIGVATADLYPSISIGGSVANAATQIAGLGSSSTGTFNVGPLLSYSFPDLLTARAHIREAGALASGALASFDGAVLHALRDVEQALSLYSAELAHRAALAQATASADAALSLADIQFKAGAASFIDLLTAQTAAVNAAQAVAASDQAVVSDQIRVFQSLGGGWENAPKVTYQQVR